MSSSREHEAFASEVGGTGVFSCSQSWAVPEPQPKLPAKQQARDVSCASYRDVCSNGNSTCLWFLWGDRGDQKNWLGASSRNHKELISGHRGRSTQSTAFGGQTEKLFRATSPTNESYVNGRWIGALTGLFSQRNRPPTANRLRSKLPLKKPSTKL